MQMPNVNAPDELELAVQNLLIELCSVMFNHGFKEVSVEDMMRLVGVPADKAAIHSGEFFTLDEEFIGMWDEYLETKKTVSGPANNTLH